MLIKKMFNNNIHGWLFALYLALSLVTLWSLYAFPHFGKGGWPSVSLKYFVNIFIGVFIGKVLVAAFMLLADILYGVVDPRIRLAKEDVNA